MSWNESIDAMRDKRIRRRLLEILDAAKVGPRGGMGGRTLVNMIDSISPRDERIADDEHAIRLLRDLAGAGFLTEADDRAKQDQRFSLDFLFYQCTTLGSCLRHQQIEKHPLVEDDRR